jgi:hypothetical protein
MSVAQARVGNFACDRMMAFLDEWMEMNVAHFITNSRPD